MSLNLPLPNQSGIEENQGEAMALADSIRNLHASLEDLHSSVEKLIEVIQTQAHELEEGQQILDKLPLLDFYNDDLQRNIENLGNRIQ